MIKILRLTSTLIPAASVIIGQDRNQVLIEEAIHVMVCYSCNEDIATNKYLYSCDHCYCKARQKSSLKKHIEAIHVLVFYSCDEDIETNKYPYSCSYCHCKTRKESSLNIH